MFEGRRLVVATKHKKEDILAPILDRELGVICFVERQFDSDIFGTFSGEMERGEDPLTTAILKCECAMKLSGCDIGIASEGSFGCHPYLPFLPANEEILMIKDKKNEAIFHCKELSAETNFNASQVSNFTELKQFAKKVKFPSHALILKKSKYDFDEMTKGITDWELLFSTFRHLKLKVGSVYVETDMRAMFNPTRQKVILTTAEKLIHLIKCLCPNCQFPGFSVISTRTGLPCKSCGFLTASTLSHLYKCQKCGNTVEELYPNGVTEEDPAFCDWCNP
jgi:hypothetical protein